MSLDQELDALMQEFLSVQEQKTNPLSERTVAEILVKLHQSGFQFTVTSDGNEYLTLARLDTQIGDCVKQRGKVKLDVLPQLLNASIDLIESRIPIAISTFRIVFHNRYLISQQYLTGLVRSIKQRLDDQGKVEIDEVAVQHEFDIQFVKKLVISRQSELGAELTNSQLVTDAYHELRRAKVLGYLSAMRSPISLNSFLAATKLEPRNIEQLIQELIAKQKLHGRYQSGFFTPAVYTKNQRSLIEAFLFSNGCISFDMLCKVHQIANPSEWIRRNLSDDYRVINQILITPKKLEEVTQKVTDVIETEGYLETSTVLPFCLEGDQLEEFLTNSCKIGAFRVEGSVCYSLSWLQKLAAEFEDRVITSAFFSKPEDPKNKKQKKAPPKSFLTQKDMQDVLYIGGYLAYADAEEMSETLLPIIESLLQDREKELQKRIGESQGILSSTFLKYRCCRSISRSLESMNRFLTTIDKKKKHDWQDSDFGSSQRQDGLYCLIYFDGVCPKGWPPLKEISWSRTIRQQPRQDITFRKTSVLPLLALLAAYDQQRPGKIPNPITGAFVAGKTDIIFLDSSGPYCFKFHLAQGSECRYVFVDDSIASAGQIQIGYSGMLGLAEKAYAKLRHCYKGLIGLGIQTILSQFTGCQSNRVVVSNEEQFQRDVVSKVVSGSFVVTLAEGQADKMIPREQSSTGVCFARPYGLCRSGNGVSLHSGFQNFHLEMDLLLRHFKQFYIIEQIK